MSTDLGPPARHTPSSLAFDRRLAPRAIVRQLVLVLGVTFAYFLTRGLIRGRMSDALLHAARILALEQAIHLNIEAALQGLALSTSWLLAAANGFYLFAHLPVLIAVAVWLYWRHPRAYFWLRNAFLISALMGLCVYVALPVAPPRFLPGFVDTLKQAGADVDGSAVGLLYNPCAAMPSLHVGWALLDGVAVVVCARAWWLKAAGAALPVLMTLAVLMTGNHFALDALAGIAVAGVSLGLAAWAPRLVRTGAHAWTKRRTPAQSIEPAGASGVRLDGEGMLAPVRAGQPRVAPMSRMPSTPSIPRMPPAVPPSLTASVVSLPLDDASRESSRITRAPALRRDPTRLARRSGHPR